MLSAKQVIGLARRASLGSLVSLGIVAVGCGDPRSLDTARGALPTATSPAPAAVASDPTSAAAEQSAQPEASTQAVVAPASMCETYLKMQGPSGELRSLLVERTVTVGEFKAWEGRVRRGPTPNLPDDLAASESVGICLFAGAFAMAPPQAEDGAVQKDFDAARYIVRADGSGYLEALGYRDVLVADTVNAFG